MRDLTPRTAIEDGGWDPRYAVLLALEIRGGVAGALVDGNGDGADISLDVYQQLSDGTWQEQSSSGGAGDSAVFCSSEMVGCYARSNPSQPILVEYGGCRYQVQPNAEGWWLFVAPAISDWEVPHVVGDASARRAPGDSSR
jgi:hypothetical protein